MYMCPPPHPSMPGMPYPVSNSRYPPPPPPPPMHAMMNPYMGYQYNNYINQQ